MQNQEEISKSGRVFERFRVIIGKQARKYKCSQKINKNKK